MGIRWVSDGFQMGVRWMAGGCQVGVRRVADVCQMGVRRVSDGDLEPAFHNVKGNVEAHCKYPTAKA